MELFSGTSLIELIQTIGFLGVVAIVFAETGLFIGFFFPGDSLLFAAGILASQGILNIYILVPALFISSVAGNITGYYFGKHVGPKLFSREDSIFFHKKNIEKTSAFFTRYGNRAIFFARFFPIIRTFTPILAGVGKMHFKTFLLYTVIGGFLWIFPLTLLGYLLGNTIPDIDRYLIPIIIGIVLISLIPTAIQLIIERRKR